MRANKNGPPPRAITGTDKARQADRCLVRARCARTKIWSPSTGDAEIDARGNRVVLGINLLRMFLRNVGSAQIIWFRRFALGLSRLVVVDSAI